MNAIEPAGGFRDWVIAMHEWAVPRYQRFGEHSRQLAEGIDKACEAPATPATLKALQSQWLDTVLVWRQLEALQLGPTLARRSSRTIDFWPTRPATIGKAVQNTADAPVSGPEADVAMERWGTSVRGLPALEWFLFSEGGEVAPLWRSPAHCLFARRISHDVADEAAHLHEAWKVEAAHWPGAPDADLQRAVNATLNLAVGNLEIMRGKKMQKGSGIMEMGGPEGRITLAFESVRSGNTRRCLLTQYEALAQLLLGRKAGLTYTREAPALGLADALRAEGFAAEAAPLKTAVKRAHRALAALPADPRQWTSARTDAAAKALRGVRAVIDPPIAQALHITISFTDADGD